MPEEVSIIPAEMNDENNAQTEPIVEEPKTEEEIALENQRIEEEKEKLEIEKQNEAKEKERLRQEVAKLENSIDSQAIKKKKQLILSDAESSGTDVSDVEDAELPDVKKNTEEESSLPIDDTLEKISEPVDPKENLKKQILQQLLKKKQEEKVLSLQDEQQEGGDEDGKNENNKQQEGGVMDMFADSGDEKEPVDETNKIVTATEIEKVTENEVAMDVDKTDTAGDLNQSVVTSDVTSNLNDIAVEIKIEKADNETDKETVSPKKEDNFETTLKTLTNIRNRMGEMSKEELEEALRHIPNLNDESDGRKTPVHLRDIVVPMKSLTEYVHDKRALYKQVFRNVNKKEFKFMLPKYLRVCKLNISFYFLLIYIGFCF